MRTEIIIKNCHAAVLVYSNLCLGFFGGPSKEAITRKINFLLLLSKIENYSPTEAVITIDSFFKKPNTNGRFKDLVREVLMEVLGIPVPVFSGHARLYWLEYALAEETFERKIQSLKNTIFLMHPDDIILGEMGARNR